MWKKGFAFGNFQWPTNKAVILVEKKIPQTQKNQDKSDVCLGQMCVDSHPENKLININIQFVHWA